MDLLTTVRKEGSRGGRGDFKWSDVQSSSHRENYLGHSLMAPVGRWQNGRDLGWYAKGDDGSDEGGESTAEKAARERKEEIKRIKEAEQDALARALGYDVPPRNPNQESLKDGKEVDKILKAAAAEDHAEVGTGRSVSKAWTTFNTLVAVDAHTSRAATGLVTVTVTVMAGIEVEVGAETIALVEEDGRRMMRIIEGDPAQDHGLPGKPGTQEAETGRHADVLTGRGQIIGDIGASLHVIDVMSTGVTIMTTARMMMLVDEQDDLGRGQWI